MYSKDGFDVHANELNFRTARTFAGFTKRHITLGFLALAATFGLFITASHKNGFQHGSHNRADAGINNLVDIHNETLGFQKVFAINLPERSDKRDSLAVTARMTNFSVEFIDGVRGSAVNPKALPYKFKQDNGTTGCWRAHLDVFSKMIREDIQTALILEDDADWDIGFKGQLEEFARGSRWLLGDDGKATHSPYGDDWDILHFGHCYSGPKVTDGRRWVIPNDPTVPPEGTRWNFEAPDISKWEKGEHPDPQVRVVYMQQYGWCLSGYAVSKRAAQRIMWWTSLREFDGTIDGGIGMLCHGGEFKGFNCISPFPRLVGKVVAAGSSAKGSDISDTKNAVVQEHAIPENVMFSARHNAERLIKGQTVFNSYFENPSGNDMTLDEITRARGYPDYVDV